MRQELGVDEILGMHTVEGEVKEVSMVSPKVREAKEYLRNNEAREAINVIFMRKEDFKQSGLQRDDFDEAVVVGEKVSYKGSKVINTNTILLIVLNFLCLAGISVYNYWQFIVITGLNKKPKEEETYGGLSLKFI